MSFNLKKERFDEIKKLISENPEKSVKQIKKDELILFVQDLLTVDLQYQGKLEKTETDLKEKIEENERLKSELEEARSFLSDTEEVTKDSEDTKSFCQKKFEDMKSTLTATRIVAIVLAVLVILQWIF